MDNLDDFIKNKLEELPVEFNEAHWQAAEEMILEDEKEKRHRFLKALFFAQLFLIMLLPTLFLIGDYYSAASVVTKELNEDLNIKPSDHINNTILTEAKEKTGNDLIVDGKKQYNDAETENTKKGIQSVTTNDNAKSRITASNDNFKNNNNSQNQSTELSHEVNNLSRENQIKPTVLSQPIEPIVMTINSGVDEELSEPSESALENKLNQDQDGNFGEQTEQFGPDVLILQKTKDVKNDEQDEGVLANQNTENSKTQNENLDTQESETEEMVIDETSAESLVTASSNLSTTVNLLPMVLSPVQNQEKETIEITPLINEDKKPFRSAVSLYLASTMYPYTQVGTEKLLGYTAGVNYTRNIQKSWSIDLGVHYRIRDGHFTNSQTSQQDSFSFGRISTEHSLQAQELHSIEVPIALAINKKRHQVLIGVNYAYLLGARGVLNKVDDFENNATIEQVDKGWFEDSSFKKNRFDVFAAYYFTIKPGLSLGAKAHYVIGGHLNKDVPATVYLESKPLFIDFGVRCDLIKR